MAVMKVIGDSSWDQNSGIRNSEKWLYLNKFKRWNQQNFLMHCRWGVEKERIKNNS